MVSVWRQQSFYLHVLLIFLNLNISRANADISKW